MENDVLCKSTETLSIVYKIIKINSSRPRDRYLYIFIGNIDDSIAKIIDKKVDNLQYILNTSEISELIKVFGKNYYKKLGFHIKDISALFYIRQLILPDDTLNIIKKKIITYISSDRSVIIENNKLHIWCIKNNLSFSESIIRLLFDTLAKGKTTIDRDYLLSIISDITPDTYNLPESLPTTVNEINIHTFRKYQLYTLFTHEYVVLGYNYYNEYGKIYFDPNPFNIHKITDFIQKPILKTHEILEDYGQIDDNIIYMTLLNDFIDSSKNKSNSQIYNIAVIKYWPHIKNIDSITSDTEYRDIVDIISKTSEITTLVNDTYYRYIYKIPKEKDFIKVNSCFIHGIKIVNNKPQVYDFANDTTVLDIRKIFNTIILDENSHVPFGALLFRDSTRYKISKAFIKRYDVDRDSIKKWILQKKKYNNLNYILYKLCRNNHNNDHNLETECFIDILIYENSTYEIKVKSDYSLKGYTFNEIRDMIQFVNTFIRHINRKCGIELVSVDKLSYATLIENINVSSVIKIENDREVVLTNLKQFLENFFPYITLVDDNTLLHFKYKRISNYVKMDEIGETIQHHYDKSKKDIVKILMKNFELTETEATSEYDKWASNLKLELHKGGQGYPKKYYFIPKIQSGIDVKISKIDIKNLKIQIEGAKNINTVHKVLLFIKIVVYLYIHKNNVSRDISDVLKKYIKIKSKTELFDKYDNAGMNKGDEEFTNLVENKRDMSKFFDNDEEDDLDFNLLLNTTNVDANVKTKATSSQEMKSSKNIQVDVSQIRNTSRNTNSNSELDEMDRDLNKLYTLNRLYSADRDLFHLKNDNYSRVCQKKEQPVVITTDEKNYIDKTYPDSYKNAINYGSTSEKRKANWYICPEAWCVRCRISMTRDVFTKNNNMCIKCGGTKLEEVKKRDVFADTNKTVIVFDRRSHVFVNFLNRKRNPHPKDLCMPCCFKTNPDKPGIIKDNNRECLEGSVEVKPDTSAHYKYIKSRKVPTESGRYGILHDSINKIFDIDLSTCGENGGTGLLLNRHDCLLRKGITHKKNMSFLSAIADIFNFDSGEGGVDKILSIIMRELNLDVFRSLNDGSLYLHFIQGEYEKNLDIPITDVRYRELIKQYEAELKHSEFSHSGNVNNILKQYFQSMLNYREYLKDSTREHDHVFLIDIVSRENILTEKGFNIIIIQNNNSDDDTDTSARLLYPIGNIVDNFKKNRPTILLHKQGIYYEPIVSMYTDPNTSESKNIVQYMYNNTTTHIKNFIDVYMGYSGYYNVDGLIDYNSIYNITLILKKLVIKYAVVDTYNRVIGLIIYNRYNDKNFFICIKNRGLILDNTSVLYPLILYSDVWDRIKLATYSETFAFIESLKSNTLYPINMDIDGIVKDSEGYIYGFNIRGLNTVNAFKREKIDTMNSNQLQQPIIIRDIHSQLNYKIASSIQNINSRKSFIDKNTYEKQSYERFRYEISELLKKNSCSNFKVRIYGVINNTSTDNNQKRRELFKIVEKMLHFFATTTSNTVYHTNSDNSDGKTKARCTEFINKKSCNNDVFCKWDNNKCYFNIASDTSTFYIEKIVDEILRNFISREEILRGKVSRIYNTTYKNIEYPVVNTEYTYTNSNIALNSLDNTLHTIKNIKRIPIINDLYTLPAYSLIPKTIHINDITHDKKILEELPSRWQRYFGIHKFSIINDGDNPLSGYFMITRILNNGITTDVYNIEIIKNTIYTYIINLNNTEKQQLCNKYITNRRNDKFKKMKLEDILTNNSNNSDINSFFRDTIIKPEAVLSELELEIISEIYGIRIVIIGNIKKTNPEGIKCLYKKRPNHKSDIIVLLYSLSGKGGNYDTFQLIQKNKNKQIVFSIADFKNKRAERDKDFIELLNRICSEKLIEIS